MGAGIFKEEVGEKNEMKKIARFRCGNKGKMNHIWKPEDEKLCE